MDESGRKWPPETEQETIQFLGSEEFLAEFRRSVAFLQRSVPGSRFPDLAEDAAMDTLTRFIERNADPRSFSFERFSDPAEFNTYFFKACHNRLLDTIKRQNRRRELLSAWSREVTGKQPDSDTTLQILELIQAPFTSQAYEATGLTEEEHEVLRTYLSNESVAEVESSGKRGAAIAFVSRHLGINRRKAYRLLESAKSKIHDCLRSFD